MHSILKEAFGIVWSDSAHTDSRRPSQRDVHLHNLWRQRNPAGFRATLPYLYHLPWNRGDFG
ncbi:hypothetical protein [Synechococcus sp. MIT S1220]|uniref:hypothetical protein n=1 Tax=Synechococcus sp. MIT S1220 TaxID=3082549 RepID=UPI0039AFA8D2